MYVQCWRSIVATASVFSYIAHSTADANDVLMCASVYVYVYICIYMNMYTYL